METHDFYELVNALPEIKKMLEEHEKRLHALESTGTYKRPTLEAVNLYAAKIGLPLDQAEWMFNFYESNGWRVGRNPMKSWQAALLNWKKNWQAKGSGVGTINGHHSPSVFELKTVLETTKSRMKELAEKHYNNSGAFPEWTNEPARQEFIHLKRKTKELETKLVNAV